MNAPNISGRKADSTVALDSVLLAPIIPAPPRSATQAAAVSSGATGPNDVVDTRGQSNPRGSTGGRGSNSSSTNGESTNSVADSSSHSSDATDSAGKRPMQSAGKANSSTRSQRKPHATHPQAANRTSSATSTADGTQGPPSFMEALAQSQADAAANANIVADAAAPEVTGTNAKTKAGADEDAAGPPSFALISQSLAAAMAGVPAPAQTQPNTTTTAADDDSTEVMSSTNSSASRALIASLTSGADNLSATPEATHDTKGDASTTLSPAADNSTATAATAFQAHLSVSAHSANSAGTETSIGRVDAAVGTAAFNEELGGKVTWMANQGLQSASLQLSPEHLGPVDVRISVQDGSATVSFNAMHADTRAALEQALPRLREMFATHGLTLTDASVSQQSPRDQAQKQTLAAISPSGRVSDESNSATLAAVASARLGLVDTYA